MGPRIESGGTPVLNVCGETVMVFVDHSINIDIVMIHEFKIEHRRLGREPRGTMLTFCFVFRRLKNCTEYF